MGGWVFKVAKRVIYQIPFLFFNAIHISTQQCEGVKGGVLVLI